jgi:sigma54-dependent transcription regulator
MASGESSQERCKELHLLEATARTLRENIANNKSAVDRLSKMPLWKEPSPSFKARQREISNFESRLELLNFSRQH